MSGRAKAEVSRDRWQRVWWYAKQGYSQRAIARQMKLALSTIQHYLAKGIPPYDRFYDTSPVPADPDDIDDEMRGGYYLPDPPRAAAVTRPANDRQMPRPRVTKPVISRSPARRPKVASITSKRRRA